MSNRRPPPQDDDDDLGPVPPLVNNPRYRKMSEAPVSQPQQKEAYMRFEITKKWIVEATTEAEAVNILEKQSSAPVSVSVKNLGPADKNGQTQKSFWSFLDKSPFER
jgi:hypothetical protein